MDKVDKKSTSQDVIFNDDSLKMFQTATIAEMQAIDALLNEKIEPFNKKITDLESQKQILLKTIESSQNEIGELKKERLELINRLKTEESISSKVLEDYKNLSMALTDAKKTMTEHKKQIDAIKNSSENLGPKVVALENQLGSQITALENQLKNLSDSDTLERAQRFFEAIQNANIIKKNKE